VEAQLEENQRRARQGQRGTRYLLQGLLVCRCCGYAYYGKPISPSGRKGHVRSYAYYRCTGSDAYRFGGERLCFNTQVRTDRLEQAVWHEVCRLLEDPERLVREYQRRLDEIHAPPQETKSALLAKRIAKVEQGIARLIDGYAEGYISKEEFEPRIRRFKERLEELNAQANHVRERAHQETELTLVIGRLEEFSVKVRSGLEDLDWAGRRELIRTLVKRVDIDKERINVVFRIEGNPALPPGNNPFLQHCWGRDHASNKRAKLWLEFSSNFDRAQLKGRYGEGFGGAPLHGFATTPHSAADIRRGADEQNPREQEDHGGDDHV
jgi:site-specific DNA recombinase